MARVQVSSSSLKSVGYIILGGELEVEFDHGGVYVYAGVPQAVFDGLMAADSKGRFFNAFIRDVYACTKKG
jgi:hypothetical protein